MVQRVGAEVGDLLLIVADRPEVVAEALGELRLEIGRRLGLMSKDTLHFAWVTDMPAFEWNPDRNAYQSKHHQFTSIVEEDRPLLETEPLKVRARQYDLVCNGYELGGGSIRIHRREDQAAIFKLIGMTEEQAQAMFGHLLEAFEYGTPPHGGIALGIDRLTMLPRRARQHPRDDRLPEDTVGHRADDELAAAGRSGPAAGPLHPGDRGRG